MIKLVKKDAYIPEDVKLTDDINLLNWGHLTVKERNLLLAIVGIIQANNNDTEMNFSIQLRLLNNVSAVRKYGAHATSLEALKSLQTKLQNDELHYWKNKKDKVFSPFELMEVSDGCLLITKNIKYKNLFGHKSRIYSGYFPIAFDDILPLSANTGALFIALSRFNSLDKPYIDLSDKALVRLLGADGVNGPSFYEFHRSILIPTFSNLNKKTEFNVVPYSITEGTIVENPNLEVDKKSKLHLEWSKVSNDAPEESKVTSTTTTKKPIKVAPVVESKPVAPVIAPVAEQTTTTTTEASMELSKAFKATVKPVAEPQSDTTNMTTLEATDNFISGILDHSITPSQTPNVESEAPVEEPEPTIWKPIISEASAYEQLKKNHPELAPQQVIKEEPVKTPAQPFNEYAYHSTEEMTEMIKEANPQAIEPQAEPELVATRELPVDESETNDIEEPITKDNFDDKSDEYLAEHFSDIPIELIFAFTKEQGDKFDRVQKLVLK